MKRLVWPLFCLAAGLITSLAFEPVKWWPLAFVGVALIVVALQRGLPRDRLALRRGAWFGYLYGLGFYGGLVPWISVLGWYVAVGLIAAMALHSLVFGLIAAGVRRLPAAPLWITLAWGVSEFTAARVPFGGFPWGKLAWTTPDHALAGWLAWIGTPGVSLLVAGTAVVLAQRWMAVRQRPKLAEIAVVGVFMAGFALTFVPPLPTTGRTVNIGMVQGNVDGTAGSEALGYARSVTNNHLSETIMLMARARTGVDPMPDFVLWPENSTDIDPTADAETRLLINDAHAIAERPLFIGIVAFGPGPDERQTTGVWWDDRGAGERYDKRNLVPFGEYIPFRDVLLPRMPILEQIGRQGVPGTGPGVTRHEVGGRPLTVGDVICFELAYDGTVWDVGRAQPDVVVVQSNNATYTASGQPRQQFEITRVRAIELRRDIVVSTTSSFSGHIDAHGRVLARTEESTAASETYTVAEQRGRAWSVVVAPWLDRVVAGVGLGSFLMGLWRRPRPDGVAAS